MAGKDRAGFIVNMLPIPYPKGAVRMVLDTALFVADVLCEVFKEPQIAATPLLRRMVAAGQLGRESCQGF